MAPFVFETTLVWHDLRATYGRRLGEAGLGILTFLYGKNQEWREHVQSRLRRRISFQQLRMWSSTSKVIRSRNS